MVTLYNERPLLFDSPSVHLSPSSLVGNDDVSPRNVIYFNAVSVVIQSSSLLLFIPNIEV